MRGVEASPGTQRREMEGRNVELKTSRKLRRLMWRQDVRTEQVGEEVLDTVAVVKRKGRFVVKRCNTLPFGDTET